MGSVPEFNNAGFTPVSQNGFSQGGFVDTSVSIARKRIIICCDGTWQSSVSGLKNVPSNVTKLARSIARSGKDAKGDVWQQIVHYDAGIGTGDLSHAEKDRQGGFGIGFVGNVIEAYNFIVLNYHEGDEIFCFGFSRGAYTARAVAGLVTDIGVISAEDMQDFPDLYALYQKHQDSFQFRKSKAYREWVTGVLAEDQPPKVQGGFQEPDRWERPPHRSAPESSRVVQVVGVFDTVGSLGIPDLSWTRWNMKFLESVAGVTDPGFHNVALSPYIKHAFHALAIDEHRGPFTPTLWHFPADDAATIKKPAKDTKTLFQEWDAVHRNSKATEEQKATAWKALVDGEMYEQLQNIDSNLSQVWFPGVHINIGGGSDDLLNDHKGDLEQIALISFGWMCEQIAPYLRLTGNGSLADLARSAVEDRFDLLRPVLDAVKKGEKDYGNQWFMKKVWETLDHTGLHEAHQKTVANSAVNGWATGPIIDSYTGMMAKMGSVYRTPGQYNKDKAGNRLGMTNEEIHPSTWYRIDKLRNSPEPYKPKPLDGWKRDPTKNGKGYVWTNRDGSVKIPEYLIKPEDAFTRYLAMQDSGLTGNASDFIGGIDKLVGAETFERESIAIRASKTDNGVSKGNNGF